MPLRRCLFLLLLFCLAIPPSARAADEPPLRFGLPPFANPAMLHESFTPLARSLAAAGGREVRLTLSPNYSSLIRAIGEGRVDIAFVGPSPYVKAKDNFGSIELLARLNMKEQVNDKVVIVTRTDSGVNTISDLAGKSFAFGDYQSFGSHFMSRAILTAHGVPPGRLAAYDFVGSHDNVILSILHGDFAAGGLRLDIFRKYQDPALKIIYGPVAIPPHALVCRASLPETIKERLRRHLLTLRDPAILTAIDPALESFGPVIDQDFELARRVIGPIESR